MPIAIVDERISEKCERALLIRGFKLIKTAPSTRLSAAVCAHPDMLMLVYKNRIITSTDYCDEAPYVFTDIRDALPNVTIEFTDVTQSPLYPNDAAFNALIVGEEMFCRTESIAPALIRLAKREGLKVVKVKQGYPACTTLVLGENSAVTADPGMAKTLRGEGFSVTEIENGDILLPPHEYGFIGGASGVYRDSVYFLGDINTHRCADKIKAACEAAGFKPISLSDEPLADLGRIIFID